MQAQESIGGVEAPREPSLVEYTDEGAVKRENWELPMEEAYLREFLTDVFQNHWDGTRYGPIIEGAAYELKASAAPTKISYFDGYMTIMYDNGGHFHLCVGDCKGSPASPTPEALRKRRKPSKGQIFRSYGRDGKPVSWGFEMWNGNEEPMISVFFPNPFITDQDTLPDEPDFSRLASWRAISKRWLGRDAEAIDEQGKGFKQQ